jgi:very-short-patch-repair endonuclease
MLDKALVQDVLFQLSNSELTGAVTSGKRSDGIRMSDQWITTTTPPVPTKDTAIERKLREAILKAGRLPDPQPQREFYADALLVTIADFVYEKEKIAIYCDGFAYHGSKEKLASDAQKRNLLQADGWAVLTFWGQTILKYPERCEEQIWRVYSARRVAG